MRDFTTDSAIVERDSLETFRVCLLTLSATSGVLLSLEFRVRGRPARGVRRRKRSVERGPALDDPLLLDVLNRLRVVLLRANVLQGTGVEDSSTLSLVSLQIDEVDNGEVDDTIESVEILGEIGSESQHTSKECSFEHNSPYSLDILIVDVKGLVLLSITLMFSGYFCH